MNKFPLATHGPEDAFRGRGIDVTFLAQDADGGAEDGTFFGAGFGLLEFLFVAVDVVDDGDVFGAVEVDVFDGGQFGGGEFELHDEAHEGGEEAAEISFIRAGTLRFFSLVIEIAKFKKMEWGSFCEKKLITYALPTSASRYFK